MADNIVPGAGQTLAGNDLGSGVQLPRVKPVWGASGSYADVDMGTGLPTQQQTTVSTGTITAAGAWSLGSIDARGYASGTFLLTGTFTANVTIQASNDGTNWATLYFNLVGNNNGNGVNSTTTAGQHYSFNINGFRYFRIYASSYTSGTATAVVVLSAAASPTTQPAWIIGGALSIQGGSVSGAASSWTNLSNGARTTSGAGSATGVNGYKSAQWLVSVLAVSGTTPTLDMKLQNSQDATAWFDIPGAVFPTVTGTGAWDMVVCPGITPVTNRRVSDALGSYMRLAYTIGGTTPSFTFAAYFSINSV